MATKDNMQNGTNGDNGALLPYEPNSGEERRFYTRLRNRITRWLRKSDGDMPAYGKYLLAAPDLFHLLCCLVLDPEVLLDQKKDLALGIVYFFWGLDVIPEFLVGPIGYLDDVVVAAYVLNRFLNENDPTIVRKHWAGDDDILRLLREISAKTNEMLGSGLWKRLKHWLKSRKHEESARCPEMDANPTAPLTDHAKEPGV